MIIQQQLFACSLKLFLELAMKYSTLPSGTGILQLQQHLKKRTKHETSSQMDKSFTFCCQIYDLNHERNVQCLLAPTGALYDVMVPITDTLFRIQYTNL